MTAVLRQPRLEGAFEALPYLEPQDIVFANVAPDRVALRVTVRNDNEVPSPATFALVQAAPLGAFVSWRPVTALAIPPMEPGETRELGVELRTGPVQVLGRPGRVPPSSVLTALAADDGGSRRSRGAGFAPGLTNGTLPADLMSLFGRTNPHWAGNLNIFFPGRAVERHLARALRIYPGRVNMALFIVGQGQDWYSFSLAGNGAGWDARLYDMHDARSLIDPEASAAVALDKPIYMRSGGLLMLALCPPADCGQGEVQVHVQQRSTGKTAVVEFSLDPNAAGPGCFVV
jgi:hypothetical protein